MDPYAVNMIPSTFVAAHISLRHAGMTVHTQDPFFEFYSITVFVSTVMAPTYGFPWVE